MRSGSVPSKILLLRFRIAFQLSLAKCEGSKSAGNDHADDDEIGQSKLPYHRDSLKVPFTENHLIIKNRIPALKKAAGIRSSLILLRQPGYPIGTRACTP